MRGQRVSRQSQTRTFASLSACRWADCDGCTCNESSFFAWGKLNKWLDMDGSATIGGGALADLEDLEDLEELEDLCASLEEDADFEFLAVFAADDMEKGGRMREEEMCPRRDEKHLHISKYLRQTQKVNSKTWRRS
jgi:hypothetical protein